MNSPCIKILKIGVRWIGAPSAPGFHGKSLKIAEKNFTPAPTTRAEIVRAPCQFTQSYSVPISTTFINCGREGSRSRGCIKFSRALEGGSRFGLTRDNSMMRPLSLPARCTNNSYIIIVMRWWGWRSMCVASTCLVKMRIKRVPTLDGKYRPPENTCEHTESSIIYGVYARAYVPKRACLALF